MPSSDRALHALRSWLDSWRGIGAVSVGMHRQGYDLHLTQYDERGWRPAADRVDCASFDRIMEATDGWPGVTA
jgi:hypothetical protein